LKPAFLISTPGGSASMWLSASLNRHPDIICHHALRRDPGKGDDAQNLTAEELVDLLFEMRAQEEEGQCVGSIHSFFDSAGGPEILERGGAFLAIVRDPFLRVHSLFSHHYLQFADAPEIITDVYGDAEEMGRLTPLDDGYKGIIPFDKKAYADDGEIVPDVEGLTETERTFSLILNQVFGGDFSNFHFIGLEGILHFEKMVRDETYLATRLGLALDIDAGEFMSIFADSKKEKTNRHSLTPITKASEVFEIWPEQFRRLFMFTVLRLGYAEIDSLYKSLEYPFEDVIRSYASKLA